MHSTEEAFFADIREHPDDDTPRLVYADWLDEYGNETDRKRAELIRLECHLARLPAPNPERDDLDRRRQQLVAELESIWFTPLRGLTQGWWLNRGFVARAIIGASDLIEHGETILRLCPVAELTIRTGAGFLVALLNCEYLRMGSRLEISDGIGDGGVLLLTQCPHLPALEGLSLHGGGIGELGVAHLLKLDLSRLRLLNLGMNSIGDSGAVRLLKTATLTKLEGLRLGSNDLCAPTARALAEAKHLVNLTDVDLGSNRLGDDGIRALASAAPLARLRRLNVRRNVFGCAGALALARSPHLQHLRELDASGNEVGQEGRSELISRFGDRLAPW